MVARITYTYSTLQTKWAGWRQDISCRVSKVTFTIRDCATSCWENMSIWPAPWVRRGPCWGVAAGTTGLLWCYPPRLANEILLANCTTRMEWCLTDYVWNFRGPEPYALLFVNLLRWEWVSSLTYTHWNCESGNVADWRSWYMKNEENLWKNTGFSCSVC